MELIDYLGIIKKKLPIILIAIIVTSMITGIITKYIPKTYTSKVILQTDNTFSIPGLKAVAINEQQESRIFYYQAMVENPSFKEEIVNLLAKKGIPLNNNSFSIGLESIQRSKLFELYVNVRNPKFAKLIADTSSQLLVEKIEQLKNDPIQLKNKVLEKIKNTDADARKIRENLNKITPNKIDINIKKTVRQLNTQDRLDMALEKRKFYADYYNRLTMQELIATKSLQIVYPANSPVAPSKPNMKNNLLFSVLAGFFVGLGLATIISKKE